MTSLISGNGPSRFRLLQRLWTLWKRFGRKVGDVQARILLTLFYFVILAPFAVALRIAADPLAIKPGAPRTWRPRPDVPGDPMVRATRQS